MLQLKTIKKNYYMGEHTIHALRGVDLAFRRNEFAAILGPSGCGKTTLLNIIGGLDQYSEGDLLINGRSTKDYNDRDWDTYRNHSIGFVFQSYNLIPHQTLLANVELALTISGISREERRQRAAEALEKVGLGDQLYKRPNQVSGGQSQRVAIARALVTDPDIILADEPTGALDSETSVQVLDLLKEVAQDKLVIMVTHNSELAERYATRIIRMRDGLPVSDSRPYDGTSEKGEDLGRSNHSKMRFSTALGLSLQNLWSKKGRTILTAFAGSIGIIGIALIFALSNGIQAYIDQVQEETLAAYPITIEREVVDTGAFFSSMMRSDSDDETPREEGAVYSRDVMYNMISSMTDIATTSNNLAPFIDYLETDPVMRDNLSAIHYSYGLGLPILTIDIHGEIIKSDIMALIEESTAEAGVGFGGMERFSPLNDLEIFQEIVPGRDGELISPLVQSQYELIHGAWPAAYDEVVLIVNSNNEISDFALYALGMKDQGELEELFRKLAADEPAEPVAEKSWTFDEIMAQEFKIIMPSEMFAYSSETEGWTDLTETPAGLDFLYNNEDSGVPLKVSGILRPAEDAAANMMQGSFAYTAELTGYLFERNNESDILRAQHADESVDVFTGLPFRTADQEEPAAEEKQTAFGEYLEEADEEAKAEMYIWINSQPSDIELQMMIAEQMEGLDREQIESQTIAQYAEQMGVDEETISEYIAGMDDETLFGLVEQVLTEQTLEQYRLAAEEQFSGLDVPALAGLLDRQELTEEQYVKLYDEFMPPTVSEATLEDNLELLGEVDPESPEAIYLYSSTFRNKDAVSDGITAYNEAQTEEDQITYTDFVALLMSSITTIINGITYLLIAFVAISLIVSSIMIGIITYISVLERTKEIGILRSIGASKNNVSNVFIAETLIEGLAAGVLGIAVAWLLTFPINRIVYHYTEIENLRAVLPWEVALALIGISIFLTVVAGLIPSRMAAKKDPVEALRTE